jgi:hypothetical protein
MGRVVFWRRLSMRPSMRPNMWRLRRMIDVITVDVDRWRTCMRKNQRVLHINTISSTRNSAAKIKERLIRVWEGILGRSRPREREILFVKDDVMGNINLSHGYIKELVPLVMTAIPNENALLGSEGELASIVGMKQGPTRTTEGFKYMVVWFGLVT